eukprot:g14268.t1 g14268   contig9:1501114-1502870(+)
MNPNASDWTPSASAPAFTPGGAAPAPAPTPPPAKQESAASDIDESDPLWQCVLNKICEGDRARAMKLINDPDSLMNYPEVVAIIAASDDKMEEDDWEKGNDDGAADELAEKMEEKMVIDEANAEPTAAPPKKEEVAEAVEGDPREHLNLVFIGHVDAGKSTLSGNILYLTDNVDKRTIEKCESEAKERNRESWFLAFIMDTNEEERAKGITVEVGRATFETEAHRYSILDAPGHKNYVPNMIMGASQADVGILVISARKGEFESGFDKGGQTREHALLAKTLGVSYLVVVINKMDEPTVQWKKERFDECVQKLKPFLKGCGFTIKKEVKFMPISGLNGANVKDEVDPKECSWWKDCYKNGDNNTDKATLMDLLDSLELKGRNPDAPVRIPVLDRYSDRGTIAMGKVESGTIRPGMKITLMPTRQKYKVDGLWTDETPLASARPGENVLVKLNGAGMEDIQKVLTAGFQAIFHAHCAEEEATVTKIFETTDRKGKVTKGAHFANVGMRVICMIELARTVPLETFDDYPFLGRFTLRTEGKTCAIGVIKKLPPKKEG